MCLGLSTELVTAVWIILYNLNANFESLNRYVKINFLVLFKILILYSYCLW